MKIKYMVYMHLKISKFLDLVYLIFKIIMLNTFNKIFNQIIDENSL